MRKFKKRTKKKIAHYIIELMVVFIGITSGFILNNWRQENDHKELEQKYLTSFYNDVQLDKIELDTLIANYEAKNRTLISIIKDTEAVKKPMTEEHAEKIVSELLYTQWATLANDTYDDIINSGNFNLISDFTLKEKISSYYTYNKDLKDTVFV